VSRFLATATRFWSCRGVVQILIARDLKARYRGTVLGFLWSFLNPLIFMSVYLLVFSVFLRIQMENYAAFLLCGLLPWTWFASAVTESSRSIIDNRALVMRSAAPSEIFPLVSIGANLMHFLLSLPILLVLLMIFGVRPRWTLVLFPLVVVVQFLFTLGLGLICAALAVRFRDLLQLTSTALNLWFFITPVFYPSTMVPPGLRPLLLLNPMAYLIGAYQNVLFYRRAPHPFEFALVMVLALVLVVAGEWIFSARRDSFADDV
jgi:lipopolysaccharide transport system permease protein